MVKQFQLTYLAKGGGGGGGGRGSLKILIIACLTFCLMLTDRPILGLPEYKSEVVNICKMHVFKFCYDLFDRFQRCVEIVRKSDE